RSWRVVTLDDAEIAAVGVPTGTRWLFRVVQIATATIKGLATFLLRVFPAAQLGLWVVVAADLARSRIWEHAQSERAWMAVLNPYFHIISTTFKGNLRFFCLVFNFLGFLP